MENSFGESNVSYITYLTINKKGVKRDKYLIIKGSVKNNGLKKVIQCLIKVNIYDKNNSIVNTNKLYIFGDIGPGKTNTFHLITSWPKSAKIYNLTIEEVRIKE
jgi:hypothetical protein